MKSIRMLLTLVALVVATLSYLGCDFVQLDDFLDSAPTAQQNGGDASPHWQASSQQPPSPFIVVGSFNIQQFGQTKLGKPEVMNVLTDVARRFDILAIQELRDKDQEVIPKFLDMINRDGSRYLAAVGPRQGYYHPQDRTTYQEQMVFLFDSTRVEILGPGYVLPDPSRKMHRPPYVAQFRCRPSSSSETPFSFVLMNVHVDYDDAIEEFGLMQQFLPNVHQNHPGEDDFILLGDLNREAGDFAGFRWMQNQFAAIPSHWKTNTRQTESYDNIVFDYARTAEFTNQCGVLNLMAEYNLTYEQARDVSDHMPVWAVFSTSEVINKVARQSEPAIR